MITLIQLEIEKIVRRRLNQIVLWIFVAMLVVVYVLLWLATGVITETAGGVSELRSALFLEGTIPFAILLIYTFGFAAGVVVIGANIGSEYEWNTIRTLTAVEPHRARILLAKLIALWLSIVLGLLIGLLVAVVTSMIITIVDGNFTLSFVDGEYLRDSGYAFLRVLVGTAPYFGLAFVFGVVGRSATSGIALAFGVLLLEGVVGGLMEFAGGWVAEIPAYGLNRNADTLSMTDSGVLDSMAGTSAALMELVDQPTVTHAVVVLLAWTAFFLATAFWAFHRQDLEYRG